MSQLCMSRADIFKEYREAKDPGAQVKILAELNDVPVSVIKGVLEVFLGHAPASPVRVRTGREAKLWTPENAEAIKELAGKGMVDDEIGRKLSLSVCTVKNIRYAYGIPIGRHGNAGKRRSGE